MSEMIHLAVNVKQRTKELGDLFGIFFEDLNHAADGGLYGELVQNRSFEYNPADNPEYHSLYAWQPVQRGNAMVKLHVETSNPLHPNNPHYLVLDVTRSGTGGVLNTGYYQGIWIQEKHRYLFSCWYRLRSHRPVTMLVRLESPDGAECYAEERILADSREWTKVGCKLTASSGCCDARLTVVVEEPVSIALDMISLFPEDTFHRRKNGLRSDLAKMLEDMKPKFMRFPGGCLVHCGSLNPEDRESMYRWKRTIGPVEERPTWRNIWQYNQSLGLGYYEYFLLCEDVGAQPLPVIPGAWDPHTFRGAEMEDMQEWIDEALDLIEFANGDENTVWGRKRCELGHPDPFNLRYLAIGNEEVGEKFFERYEIIHQAVKDKYPEIRLISSAGPGPAGTVFERGWEQARKLGASYVDEHYYQSPNWFVSNAHRYEKYPADGTQAFLGEYASKDDTWWNALTEAAFMVGMEKAPGLGLACYAPLFCHVEDAKWKPDLICFNRHQVYGTPSYYVQKLMMNHQGDWEVALQQNAPAVEKRQSKLQGEIAFISHNNHISIEDVSVINSDTGESINFDDFALCEDHQEHLLTSVTWSNYTVRFRAARHDECDAMHHDGGKPFILEFARLDENNKFCWNIDGWMSMHSVTQQTASGVCDLVLCEYPHKKNVWYHYELNVHADEITTKINEQTFPVAKACSPAIDALYSCASIEEKTGDLIIKAVNLQPVDAVTHIELNGFNPAAVNIWQMAGFRRTDRNSFDEPQRVSPTATTVKENVPNRWTLPPESITILRFRSLCG